jgi:hypothetical protein
VPATSSDAETVGLYGAIHKRLWEIGQSSADLDTAIRAYVRGYFLKSDYYNGINFAFLLNARAALSQGDDAIADRVLARRTRREGWRYGPQRNDVTKENPTLVPYQELPESEKEYDRQMAMETLKAIIALGYRIEKS